MRSSLSGILKGMLSQSRGMTFHPLEEVFSALLLLLFFRGAGEITRVSFLSPAVGFDSH
jgi:hypothetical protein